MISLAFLAILVGMLALVDVATAVKAVLAFGVIFLLSWIADALFNRGK